MVEYRINITTSGTHKEYGIDVIIDNYAVDSITGITDNYSDIKGLAEFCNELEVEPCHFIYVIEDYLTDFKVN